MARHLERHEYTTAPAELKALVLQALCDRLCTTFKDLLEAEEKEEASRHRHRLYICMCMPSPNPNPGPIPKP